ncbi:MAG: LL-diaminopimelate aminotransferase [Candidatus Omnitrophota bacterium]
MNVQFSDRLKRLPPYLFVEIDKAKKKMAEKGADVIDLGVGDPDQPTPKYIIESMRRAVLNPATHRYALDQGDPGLRTAIAGWYKKRFGVALDPKTEILPLIGSKEGIAHIPLAFINAGDIVLIPEPCYPPYKSGTIFAGGIAHIMPLTRENGFLPDFKHITGHVLRKTRMMFINYPNNPTGAVCDKEFFRHVVKFAERENIIICHDAAYSEMSYDGYRAPSFLEVKGAKEVGVEFHSYSKTFNMTGWRVGFVCGNASVIEGLAKVKSNIDSGIFTAIQTAGIEAFKQADRHLEDFNRIYRERRNILIDGLNGIGWKIEKPKATFYVWAPVLQRYTSITLAKVLLEEAAVVVTPGNGFGSSGEGYIRMALTVSKDRIREAVERIRKVI